MSLINDFESWVTLDKYPEAKYLRAYSSLDIISGQISTPALVPSTELPTDGGAPLSSATPPTNKYIYLWWGAASLGELDPYFVTGFTDGSPYFASMFSTYILIFIYKYIIYILKTSNFAPPAQYVLACAG